MCGRIALYSDPDRMARVLEARLALGLDHAGAPGGDPWAPSWNVAPTRPLLGASEAREGGRVLRAYRWGLVPHWSEGPDSRRSMFNARAESLARRPAYRELLGRGRILIPVDAFYEWRATPGSSIRTPFVFTRADGAPVVLAGLADRWRAPDGTTLRSATIITTAAGPDLDGIHDRMPVVLDQDRWERWLDRAEVDPDELDTLLRPAAAGTLERREVGRAVGNVANDGPQLLAPATLF